MSGSEIDTTAEPDTRTTAIPPNTFSSEAPPFNEPAEKGELGYGGVFLDEGGLTGSPMLPYVRMVVGLIEGVRFTAEELVDRLLRTMRQHSIVHRRRSDYILHFLHQHPP